MTFYKWLMSKKNQDNHIGDIANEIYNDTELAEREEVKTYRFLKAYLEERNACDNAIDCLMDAYEEFKITKKHKKI